MTLDYNNFRGKLIAFASSDKTKASILIKLLKLYLEKMGYVVYVKSATNQDDIDDLLLFLREGYMVIYNYNPYNEVGISIICPELTFFIEDPRSLKSASFGTVIEGHKSIHRCFHKIKLEVNNVLRSTIE